MKRLLYIGTYTEKPDDQGIYTYIFDDETGKLERLQTGAVMTSPSFGAVDKDILYAVSEQKEKGRVEAYRINTADGSLTFISSIDVPGSAMCHVTVWPGEKFLSCANYLSGSFCVIPCENGILGEPTVLEKHEGTGFLSTTRQEAPHVHSTALSPDGRFLLAADLGLDWVEVMQIDPVKGRILPLDSSGQIHTPGGEGPRHMTFSADGRFLYLCTELGNKCFVYAYNQEDASTDLIQSVSLIPDDFTGATKAAHIQLSGDGEFLYLSNRGHDSIAVFQVNKEDGKIDRKAIRSSEGIFPRHFVVTERFAIVGNRHSNEIKVMTRDVKTGLLGDTVDSSSVRQPVWIGLTDIEI